MTQFNGLSQDSIAAELEYRRERLMRITHPRHERVRRARRRNRPHLAA